MRYRQLDSLTDYVLVSAEQPWVEHHARQPDESWTSRTYHQGVQAILLAGLHCELPLAETYKRVTLA